MLEENLDWVGSKQAQPRCEDPPSKFLVLMFKANEDVNESILDLLTKGVICLFPKSQ